MEAHLNFTCYLLDGDDVEIARNSLIKSGDIRFIPAIGTEFCFEGIYQDGIGFALEVASVDYYFDTEQVQITFVDITFSSNDEFGEVLTNLSNTGWEIEEAEVNTETEE